MSPFLYLSFDNDVWCFFCFSAKRDIFHCIVSFPLKFDLYILWGFEDFIQEARNSEKTANNFKNNKYVKIPRIFWV